MVNEVPGDLVECGIGTGETFFMLTALASICNRSGSIWGFDSFEGFPEPTKEDSSPRATKKGEWNLNISPEYLLEKLKSDGIPTDFVNHRVRLVKGFFSESLSTYSGEVVAFLHLDVDLYQSYKETLEYFWPKIAVGGVVLFDEYIQPGVMDVFPGAAKAIDEFFGENKAMIQYDQLVHRYYIIKKSID